MQRGKSLLQQHTQLKGMSATPSTALDPYKPFPSIRNQRALFTSSSPFTPTYVQAHTPSNSSAYTTRVQGRQILLENPARESRRKKINDARKARQEQDAMRRKAGILSRRQAKLTGAWKLGKRDLKCVSFPPINYSTMNKLALHFNIQIPVAPANSSYVVFVYS